jgi:hypothetical protein
MTVKPVGTLMGAKLVAKKKKKEPINEHEAAEVHSKTSSTQTWL